jgi:MFS transporter, DHA1 family, inner membrane transport protein
MFQPRSPLLLSFSLWLAGLGAAGQFAKVGVIYDYVGKAYAGSSVTLLGLLVSGVGMVGLVFGSTAGIILARTQTRNVMIVALLAAAFLSFVQSLLPPLPVFLALRFVEGFTHLAIVVAGPVIIAQSLTGKDRDFGMTLWSTFFGVCFAFMAWAGRPLVEGFGIGALFVAHGAFMVVMALVMAALLPTAEGQAHAPLSFTDIVRQHGEIYASPRIAAPALGFMFYTMMYVAILSLLPPMIGAPHQAFLGTAVPLVSIAASMTLGAFLISRYAAVAIVQGGFAIAALATIVMWLGWGTPTWIIGGALLLSAAVGLVQSASFAAIGQLNESHNDRSRATGAIAQLGNLGTTTGTPVLAALIANYGVNGLAGFAFLLSVGGVAVHAWLKMRRARA